MEDGRITDSQIIASSVWDGHHAAQYARLNRLQQSPTKGSWSAKHNDLNQWIQVDLGVRTQVTGVLTQGRNAYGQWVTEYKVQYGDDGVNWQFVMTANGQSEQVGIRPSYCSFLGCIIYYISLRILVVNCTTLFISFHLSLICTYPVSKEK